VVLGEPCDANIERIQTTTNVLTQIRRGMGLEADSQRAHGRRL
jgi:hypothetical protein